MIKLVIIGIILEVVIACITKYIGIVIALVVGGLVFATSLRNREPRKCFAIAFIVGFTCYGLFVFLPNWLFQIELDKLAGAPGQPFQQLRDTPLGVFKRFASSWGTGLSFLAGCIATKNLPARARNKQEFHSANRLSKSVWSP